MKMIRKGERIPLSGVKPTYGKLLLNRYLAG